MLHLINKSQEYQLYKPKNREKKKHIQETTYKEQGPTAGKQTAGLKA